MRKCHYCGRRRLQRLRKKKSKTGLLGGQIAKERGDERAQNSFTLLASDRKDRIKEVRVVKISTCGRQRLCTGMTKAKRGPGVGSGFVQMAGVSSKKNRN